jgi:hypothetical protein
MIICVVATLVFVGALVTLGWRGYSTALDIKGGTERTVVRDPNKAGYEAQVKPVASHLLLHVGDQGEILQGELLVPNTKGGVLVPIPSVMFLQVGLTIGTVGSWTEKSGLPSMFDALQQALGFAISDVVTVNPATMSEWLSKAGPLTFDNPDALVLAKPGGGKEIAYQAGPLTLEPARVPAYLAFVSEGETAFNRSSRSQLVWKAWLTALRANPAAVPEVSVRDAVRGEEVNLGTVFGTLAQGDVSVPSLPLNVIDLYGTNDRVYQIQPDELAKLTPSIVAYPTSPVPGARLRVRLLNGTTDLTAATKVAAKLVVAGGEIAVMGNATNLDNTQTTVTYTDPAMADKAQKLAAALGVTATQAGAPDSGLDVMIVLGPGVTG